MKKVVSRFVSVLLALSRSATVGENLITNGGFELSVKMAEIPLNEDIP